MEFAAPDDLPKPRDFKALEIDPSGEIERIESSARDIERDRREDAAEIRPAFEAGHYRDGSSRVHIGAGDPAVILMYEFDQLVEHVGLPLRINHVNVCAEAAMASVEVACQPNVEWYVWLLRGLHSHLDKPFERHFSRVAIARMAAATSTALISILEFAVTFWTRRFKDARGPDLQEDFRRSIDVLRLLLMTLSRLTVRMTPDQAANVLRKATDMAKDPQVSHYWLLEALGELAKHAVKAVPFSEQGALALAVLEFPLPPANAAQHPSWPQLVADIWNVPPVRDPADIRWETSIRQFIAAAEKGQANRANATLGLAYLAMRNALRPDEAAAFGKALWSDIDAQDALPANTGLSPSAFLQLPAPEGIDVKARVGGRLLNANLRDVMRLPTPAGTMEVSTKIDHLASLTNAAQHGLTISADRAARMFDEILTWEPQEIDRRDPFATSFIRTFNDRVRYSAGHLLTGAVVPAMQADQRTEQRAQALIAFIARARSWTSMGALLHFLPAGQKLTDDTVSVIRTGLLGSEYQHAASAAQAIEDWAKLRREGSLPEIPRPLIEQLIATIETREIGLQAMLATARTLLKDNFFVEGDFKRLIQAISRIRRELRYEDVDFDSMGAVSVSLIRAECVKLAVALKDHVADDGALQAWIDEAKTDPLPEVRFSLTDI